MCGGQGGLPGGKVARNPREAQVGLQPTVTWELPGGPGLGRKHSGSRPFPGGIQSLVSVLRHTVEGWGTWPHVEVLHGLGDVELVHGGDDDGRGGEEEEEDEEDDIDDQAAQPPDEAADGEVLPGRKGRQSLQGPDAWLVPGVT